MSSPSIDNQEIQSVFLSSIVSRLYKRRVLAQPTLAMSLTPSAASSASSPLASNVVPPEIRAPLIRVLPYIAGAFRAIWRSLIFSVSLLRPILHLSPVPVLSYILAPVLVFLHIIAVIFVVSPYKIIAYLLDALFPLYVFCGVACITGIVLGVIARVLCRLIVTMMQPDDVDVNLTHQDSLAQNNTQNLKGKGRDTKSSPS